MSKRKSTPISPNAVLCIANRYLATLQRAIEILDNIVSSMDRNSRKRLAFNSADSFKICTRKHAGRNNRKPRKDAITLYELWKHIVSQNPPNLESGSKRHVARRGVSKADSNGVFEAPLKIQHVNGSNKHAATVSVPLHRNRKVVGNVAPHISRSKDQKLSVDSPICDGASSEGSPENLILSLSNLRERINKHLSTHDWSQFKHPPCRISIAKNAL